MVNNVSNLKFSNFSYQVSPSQMNLKTMETPEKEALIFDSVNFMSKSKEKDSYKTYSCKDADMLKYDLEYSKPGFFKGKYEINGDDVELEVKNKFGGVQNVFGEAYGKRMDIDIDSGFFGVRKGEVTGFIGDAPIYLKYQVNENAKNVKIQGDFESLDKDSQALVIMLINDKLKHDLRSEQEMEMVAISTVLR